MIIKTHNRLQEGLVSARFEGDYLKATHVADITPVLERAYKERQANMGTNLPRLGETFEKIATVPEVIFVEHPEFLKDTKALTKWLKSDEGKQYRTSTRNI